MSTQPPVFTSTYWPPVTALPGLALRALWRVLWALMASAMRWALDPGNRRTLTVLPIVLLGHLLLIWLLVQNRWIVMSSTTVTFMPPIMASIVLSEANPSAASAREAAAPWGRKGGARGDNAADLKPSFELSLGAPRVQRSVPWLNTELLPELRGNSADELADRRERTERATKRDPARPQAQPRNSPTQTARQPKPQPATATAQAARSSDRAGRQSRTARTSPQPGQDVLLSIPPPPVPDLALIPPPPAANDLPLMPVPLAAETRPAIPTIPEPATAGPREIPPLWSQQLAPPPPKLTAIAPPPPVLKSIPVPAAPSVAVAPVTPVTPVTPPPVPPLPQPEPPAPPRAMARSPAPALPTPAAAVVASPPAVPAPVTPPPVSAPASPPLALTATPALPTAAAVSAAIPAATVPAAVTAMPTPQVQAVAGPSAAAPEPAPVRNPMVVEVPRYRMAEPVAGSAGPGAGGQTSTDAMAEGRQASGSRSGPDGAGGRSGSALGLGAASPAPLPVASASSAAPVAGKPLNLSLPRVEVYRSGIGPVRQPNFAEQANAQLRRGGPKDPMAEAINSAENPDCLKDGGMGLLGAPVAAYRAMTGKCK